MCSVAVQQKEAFNKDYEFGRSAEVSILDTIRRFFNDTTITPSTDKYSRYDYTGATAKYELKTRRLTRNRFATTMLPLGKLLAENPTGNIFLFKYTDGLFYIPYDQETFSNFTIAPYCRQDRVGFDVEQDYIYIPVNLLTQII
jgi:hypothetical protein